MIILKKFKKLIPSFRHKTDIQIFDNSRLHTKYKLYNKKSISNNLITRKKKLFKAFCYSLNFVFHNNLNLITTSYSYNMKPYKKIITCQTLTGEIYNIPGIDSLNIGKILLTQINIDRYVNKFNCKGILTYL